MRKTNIAIVGGGATGMAALYHLLCTIQNANITIFDPNKKLGQGIALNVASDHMLLNTDVGSFSLLHDDSTHFHNWIINNRSKLLQQYPLLSHYTKNSFVPRSLAALYIKDNVERLMKTAHTNNNNVIHETSLLKEYITDNLFVDSNDEKFQFDKLILCTGHAYNKSICPYGDLKSYKGYYNSPYPGDNIFNTVTNEKRILIIGSKLSAIDIVISLYKKGFDGSITIASKSGKLPSVRKTLNNYSEKYLNINTINQFLDEKNRKISLSIIKSFILKELKYISDDLSFLKEMLTEDDVFQTLKNDICLCEKDKNKWEQVVLPSIIVITHFWRYLSDNDKIKTEKLFLKFKDYVSSMPLCNAIMINSMIADGQLNIHGNLQSIRNDENTFHALISGKEYQFDLVVNATGIYPKMEATEKLYDSLKVHKLISSAEDSGLLLDNNNFSILDSGNNKVKVYAAGPALQGNFPVTNFFIEAARHCRLIAETITSNISLKAQKNGYHLTNINLEKNTRTYVS